MKKTFVMAFAMLAMALSVSASAATDHFKPGGIASAPTAAALAVPTATSKPADIAVAYKPFATLAEAHQAIQVHRSPVNGSKVAAAEVRPFKAMKFVGTRADRVATIRLSGRLTV